MKLSIFQLSYKLSIHPLFSSSDSYPNHSEKPNKNKNKKVTSALCGVKIASERYPKNLCALQNSIHSFLACHF